MSARREATNRRLVEAGRALIAEKGVAGLRIQEITEGAGVALGSFYNYFSDKEELVEAIVSESLASLAAAIVTEASPDEDPARVVAVAHHRFVRLAHEDPDFARLVVNLTHADELFDAAVHPWARTALERGIDAGRFEVPDLEVAVTAVVGAALAVIRAILDGRHGSGAEVPHVEIVLRALGVPREEAQAISRETATAQATA